MSTPLRLAAVTARTLLLAGTGTSVASADTATANDPRRDGPAGL